MIDQVMVPSVKGGPIPDYAVTIQQDPERIETVFQNAVSLDDSIAAAHDAKRLGMQRGLHRFLCDTSLAATAQTRADQFRFVLKLTEDKIYEPSDALAVVVAPNSTGHEFVENALQDRGYRVRYFLSRDAALDWLSGEH